MVKVAVITRTKDRPILLERALKSVHEQTFTDFIHVIINDAGKKEPVDRLTAQYGDKVQVIHNETSGGMEAASNKAIKSVKSVYVAIHDDDDTWHPEFLERTVKHLEETNAMGVVVRTDKILEEIQFDGAARRIKTEQWMPHIKAINLYRQCIDNQMTPITFIYRRSVFDEIGYYDESLPVSGDWDFGIRFLQKWDVDFLDPGFALANYHHRKFKPGAEGNTSYAGNDKARRWTNYLMNKYLREELAEGRLGVGYIMSKLRYDESKMAQMASRVIPKPITKYLKKRIQN
jgi:glycosyltransferase involved in cell wall biosynthesis